MADGNWQGQGAGLQQPAPVLPRGEASDLVEENERRWDVGILLAC